MIKKLQAALEQKYGGILGSKNKIYEEVAAAYGNLITSEEQIPAIVAGVEPMLKSYQSAQDKIRSLESKPKEEPTPQPSDPANNPEPNPEPKPQGLDVDALVERLNAAWEQKLQPLQEKLTAFETTRAKETAVAALDKFCADWDYAGGFPKERDEAKRIALKIYKAGGEQMNGEQLIAAFREEFDPAVKSKGVTDFSQPFQSDGGAGDKPDFSADVELMKSEGVDFGE